MSPGPHVARGSGGCLGSLVWPILRRRVGDAGQRRRRRGHRLRIQDRGGVVASLAERGECSRGDLA